MKCSEYFGVQFAQGQYLMHWEAGDLEGITDHVFAKKMPISVSYDGLGNAIGQQEVRAYFHKLDEMRVENGGLLRLDLPHTQRITVAEDGNSAVGQWETMTLRVMGAAFGNEKKEAPLDYAIGRYKNEFVLEEGIWKIKSVKWRPVVAFGDWKAKNAAARCDRPYPKPFEEMRGIDDATASAEAVLNCEVRNQVMGFFHDFNRLGSAAIDGRFTEDAAHGAHKMLDTSCNIEGYQGSVMATSPIVAVEPERKRAQIYVNIGRILPVNDHQIAHSRGRVCAELLRQGENWIFQEFTWYRYATMEPWDVRSINRPGEE